jgi:hypothetical protein
VALGAKDEDDFLGGDIRPQPAEVENLGLKVVGPAFAAVAIALVIAQILGKGPA